MIAVEIEMIAATIVGGDFWPVYEYLHTDITVVVILI